MIVLDYQDRRPLYEQVEEKFRNLILNGALESGSRMPSVRQLAMELSINPNTIQRAYMQLEQEGLIYPVKGKGNYIADSEEVRKISIASYTKELKDLIRKGKAIGVEEEDLIYIIRECYKEEKQ
nr:GntR family transcriptional regulator [uncultured Blautia sp.]